MSFVAWGGNNLVQACVEIMGYSSGKSSALGVYLARPDQVVLNASTFLQPLTFETWGAVGLTAVTSGYSDPDGGTQGRKLKEDASNGTHRVISGVAQLSSSNGPSVVFTRAKAAERSWLKVRMGSEFSWVNCATGAAGSHSANANSVSTPLSDSWYEFTTTFSTGSGTDFYYHMGSADGVESYIGTLNSGLLLYNAEIAQNSITTWRNLLGDIAFRDYGDRFDFTNATKASQPVWDLVAWNGLPGLRFSSGNFIFNDLVAALVTGTDKPFTLAALVTQSSAGGAHWIASLESADATGHTWSFNTAFDGFALQSNRKDGVDHIVNSTQSLALNTRAGVIYSSTGTTLSTYKNGATEAGNPFAQDAGAMTLGRFSVGCRRYGAGPTLGNYWPGIVRALVIATPAALTAQSAAALDLLLRSYCPL